MSTLKTVKDEWESLAERDALSAILTDKTKANGKWSIEDFMRTGRAEVETVIGHLEALNCTPDSSRAALDFGCGVGRLTQALARHFDSCIGVDISPSMIQKAVELNQYPHCRYIVHSDVRLPFADSSFSFIYSNIVLQHMPRQYSEGYIREFLRVLDPNPRSFSSPFQNQDDATNRPCRYGNALSAGIYRQARAWCCEDRGYTTHEHCGKGL